MLSLVINIHMNTVLKSCFLEPKSPGTVRPMTFVAFFRLYFHLKPKSKSSNSSGQSKYVKILHVQTTVTSFQAYLPADQNQYQQEQTKTGFASDTPLSKMAFFYYSAHIAECSENEDTFLVLLISLGIWSPMRQILMLMLRQHITRKVFTARIYFN